MKSTLYFLQYNNYYDRVSKVEDSLSEYMDYVIFTLDNVNFVPNDGVDTTVPNIPLNVESLPADYLLVVESGKIKSRWFIMDATRQLSGVWNFTLHRDVIADYRDEVIQMPCFVEKGIIDEQDNTIFNNEGMTYNQIKQSEQLIKDKSDCQWIVGYYARKTGEDYTNLTGTSSDYNVQGVISFDNIQTDYQYWKYQTQDYIGNPTKLLFNTLVKGTYQGSRRVWNYDFYKETNWARAMTQSVAVDSYYNYTNESMLDTALQKIAVQDGQIGTLLGYHTATETEGFFSQVGRVLYDSTSKKYYKVTGYTITSTTQITGTAGTTGTLHDLLNQCFIDAGMTRQSSALNPSFPYTMDVLSYRLTISEVLPKGAYSYNIPTTRNHTTDAPYDIFAIPYGRFNFTGNSATVTTTKEIGMSVATSIASTYGSTFLYDLQLLPYCPFEVDSTFYTTTDELSYSYIKDSTGLNKGVIFNVSSVSRQTFTVPLSIPVTDVKVDNETKFCRLVSPDFSSIYEFSPAKNRGVDYIKIDMTLKPFQPYIHLAPNFKGLNGADFDDARGLICGGSFSLPIVTDQWRTYQLQNINYEKMFNRQIQNMEVNNSVQREQEMWQMLSGTLQGGAAGAVVGNTFGGVGAMIGGGVGTALSLAGGLRDLTLSEQLRQETMSYTKDMHNLQMQNIKALPNSLSKVDAFNQQNKCFPFVEIYDCTNEEKLNLCNKIKYTGMTVNRIGKLIDYVKSWSYPSQAGGDDKWVIVYHPYIKGQLILSSGIDYVADWNIREDNHFIATLAQEISKGVYYV